MKTVAQRSSKLTSSALESCGTLATLSRFAAAFFSACLVFPSPWPPCEASLYETRYLTLFRLPAAKDGNVKCKWYALIALKIPPYAKVFVSEYLMESSLMNLLVNPEGPWLIFRLLFLIETVWQLYLKYFPTEKSGDFYCLFCIADDNVGFTVWGFLVWSVFLCVASYFL